MGRYGEGRFSVFGKLVEKPQLLNNNGFETAKMHLEVTTKNSQTKEEKTEVIPITAIKFDAQSISKYGVAGAFYYITGVIRSREWTNQEGRTSLIMELQASKIMGGPNGQSEGNNTPTRQGSYNNNNNNNNNNNSNGYNNNRGRR